MALTIHTLNVKRSGVRRPHTHNSQALVGRELVKRQVLRAPAGVCTFVETTVHVRRHIVVVVAVVAVAAAAAGALAARDVRACTCVVFVLVSRDTDAYRRRAGFFFFFLCYYYYYYW